MEGQHETAEEGRLRGARGGVPWRRWGPYLSERQWGTVREDYSEDGNAWNSFPHDHARSRVYRWGEDGLAGISDDHQLLCFALALWNGAGGSCLPTAYGPCRGGTCASPTCCGRTATSRAGGAAGGGHAPDDDAVPGQAGGIAA